MKLIISLLSLVGLLAATGCESDEHHHHHYYNSGGTYDSSYYGYGKGTTYPGKTYRNDYWWNGDHWEHR